MMVLEFGDYKIAVIKDYTYRLDGSDSTIDFAFLKMARTHF